MVKLYLNRILRNFGILVPFLLFTLSGIKTGAQTLSAGDIAIVGYNYDASPQEMAIVALADITSGTKIYISDYGYDESTSTFGTTSVANTAEGAITWTTTSTISAGTLIKFTINANNGSPIVTGLPGTVSISGWTNISATTSPSPAGGDNWFIYQGTSPTAVSNFIFAWCNPFASTFNGFPITAGQFLPTGAGTPNNTNSYLPPSLTLGTTAIALTTSTYHGDNNIFTGIISGTKSAILTDICNVTKWNHDEATVSDISPGGGNFSANPSFTITSATPAITSATYDASTGVLTVTGSNFTNGGTVNVSNLTITGEGSSTYTLTTSNVTTSGTTTFSISLNATDKAAINQILNKNGTSSTGATTYNLAATANWDVTASSPADLTGNGITVSNVAVPAITSATYDASTGSLAVTGSDFLSASGATNDIVANKFTITGEGGSTYTLTNTSNVEITSGTSFTLTLSATDKAGVNLLVNKNGTSSTGGTTYNLAAAEDWAAGANAAVVVADATGNGITASNVAVPAITSATYDASTGSLVVTGTGFLSASGATNDIVANKFTITGEGGSTYTLTNTSNVEITSGTSFTLTLSATDKAGVNLLVNKNGTASTGGTTYNLAAAEDWAAGANAAVVVADATGNGITVSNVAVPVITSATYDASTGSLVVTGTGFLSASGATNDIVANKFTITGEGGSTYTLTNTSNVEITSGTSFTLTLSATDKAGVNLIVNKNGTASTGGTTYNLAAAEDWAAGANAAVVVADATGNGITASNVAVPAITSATYDASTGSLAVTGSDFLSASGATNDIVANKFTITGEGGSTYTLTNTSNVEITSGTSFTLTLSATDKAGVNLIVNKNGTASTGGTTYNLAAAEDWAAGANAAVVVADATGNGITASNVAVPAITSATYNANTGALVVTGTGFLSASGATNDIVANKFTITGEGGSTYTLTDTGNGEITSGTSFTLTLSATDKAGVNLIVNKNGTASADATTYNLAAAEDWAAGADAAVTIADLMGNGVTASNIAGISTSGTLSAVNTTYGSASASPTSFSVSGSSLTNDILITPPSGFEVSTSSSTGYGGTVTLTPASGNVSSTTVYVRLKASATVAGSPYSGNIVVSSTGAVSKNVATVSSTVSAKPITITGISISDKAYDQSTSATITGTAVLSGLESGDVVTLGGSPSAAFSSATAGTNKAVTVSGYSISGADAGNYSLTQPTGLTASITAKALSITGISIIDKTYNASTAASISGTAALSGLESGDAVTLGGSPSAAFSSAAVGTNKAVTVSGYSISGTDAANYSLTQPAGLTASITAKGLTITGISISDKAYDKSTSATITGTAALNGLESGDVVILGGSPSAAFSSAAVGTNKAVTVSGYSISGTDAGNYSLTQPAGLTANITAKPITITGISISDKAYDQSTSATITGTAVLSGLESGDVVTLGGSPSAAFSSAAAGTNKAVTVSGYSISGADAGNYSLTQPTGLTASITAKALSITGISIIDKTYNASTAASISGTAALSGLESGDAVTLGGSPSAAFSSAAVGTNKAVTVSGYSISGTDAANYSLAQPAGLTASITAKGLTITGISISDKAYDKSTSATITGTAALNGLESGDVVILGGSPSAAFSSTAVGTNKAVTVSGYSISGTDAGNYSLTQPAGLTANITAKSITITGISISDKAYDQSTSATITGTAVLSGLESGDVVTLGGSPSAAFSSAAAGTNKAVTVSGYSISGADAGNYSLTQPAGLTASITAKALSITGISIIDKTYNASTAASISGTAALSGLESGDAVTLGGSPSAAFSSAAVGTNKAVTVSGYSISGTDAANYSLAQPAGLTASITAKSITITGISISDKAYDKSTSATITGTAALNGVETSDLANVSLGGSPVATFADALVGNSKAVTVSGYSISGTDAGNYSLTQPAGLTANITAKSITITGISISDKAYDQSTSATITGTAVLSGLESGDVVTLGGSPSAAFTTATAGTNKAVTVSGYSISGADAGNYSLTQPTGLTASITAKALSITGISISDKTYNASTAAAISGTAALSGLESGDAVTLGGSPSAAFSSAAVGTNKAVTVSGYSISGADAANYSLTQPAGLTASITAKSITITGISISDKAYDKSTSATITGTAALNGVETGDVANVSLGGSPVATFADALVGNSKAVTVSGYSISGSASGNYSLTQPAGLTANITAKSITITGISISDKAYDQSTSATITGTAVLSGLESGDVVTLGGSPSAAFTTATAGTNKAVTVSGYSISGADAGNYSLTQPAGLTASITAKALSITGISIIDKTYNASTAASISGTAALSGLESGDAVTLGGSPSAVFSSAAVGTNKAVTVSGYSISGADAANYSLTQPAGLTASITAKSITITGISISDKAYDKSTSATITGTAALNGVETSDLANVSLGGSPVATFADALVGNSKAVTVSGYSISGSASGNYSLSQPAGLTANITAKVLTASLTGTLSKTYDGTTTATLTPGNYSLAGVLGSESVILNSPTSGIYDNKNVGAGKTVSVTGLSLSGADAGNYTLSATTVGGAVGEIKAKSLTVSLTGTVSKTYDGTTAATLASGNYSLAGVLGSESVMLNNPTSGTYDNKNVGTGKTVSVTGLSLSGVDAGNYSLSLPTANAAIGIVNKKDITASLNSTPAITKVYDGTSTAALASANYTLTGVETGDVVTVSGVATYNNSTVATGKAVTANSLVLDGAQKDNYNLTTSSASTTGTITKKVLTVTADNKTKFQNTANPPFTIAYSGFVSGENESSLSTQPTASTIATNASPIGTYAITPAGGVAVNYSFNYVNGTLTIVPGAPTNITLVAATLYENAPAATVAGELSSTSDDPAATFTYSLVSGTGDTDNAGFVISGNQIRTAGPLNFEQKSSYSVLVRSTTQNNLSLDKVFTINIENVNEQPTLSDMVNQVICYTASEQAVVIGGISAGPDANQTTTTSVSTTNSAMFESLTVSQANGSGNATIKYKLVDGAFGSSVINVMVMDNGGTTNGGVNTILKSFVLQVNQLPEVSLSSGKGLSLSKGDVTTLRADVAGGSSGLTYNWATADGIVSGQATQNLTVRPSETTTYRVTVSNSNGCASQGEITIIVNPDYQVVKGTNILSPNGDGVNDKLVIRNIDMYPQNELKVFDKAGRLVYQEKNYSNNWGGTSNGSVLTEDTYYYIVDFGDRQPKIKGFVSIVTE